VALSQGIWATFMPKPFTDHPGSGMHTHVSLFEGDRNAFYEAGAEYQLSKTGRQFIAGILHHAAEITASPTSGSTPTSGWSAAARRRRTSAGATTTAPRWCGCRCTSRNKGQSTRIELRTPDSACNPYLAFAVILAAGMKGIEEGYELPREAEDDVWALTDRERKAWASSRCRRASPRRSGSENSELLAETLGEHVFDFFLRNKRQEWEEYRARSRRSSATAAAGALKESTGPGWFGGWLRDEGIVLDVAHPYLGTDLPDPTAYDGVLVLGGAMGPAEDERCPWLPATRALMVGPSTRRSRRSASASAASCSPWRAGER
jgi:hypothetical protein